MKVVHGSKIKNIEFLGPRFMSGSNGSMDGVGVNLTSNVPLALNYATKDGSVYIVDIDTSNYLTVSENSFLSDSQVKTLTSKLKELPDNLRYRFATDMCGKEVVKFSDDDKAEEFYKLERIKIKGLDLGLDRMMPMIDPNDDVGFSIKIARNDFNFDDVSTKHIHYCLNLYDNCLSTDLLKSISSGLILEKEDGRHNYLSFNGMEKTKTEISGDFLIKENCAELIENALKEIEVYSEIEY
jgi:hypothetical protein